MFRMYDVDRGWAPYSGSSPHTDHVHFSLTRDGGAGRVSYWNPTFRAPANWAPDQRRVAGRHRARKWDTIRPLSGRLRRRPARRPPLVRPRRRASGFVGYSRARRPLRGPAADRGRRAARPWSGTSTATAGPTSGSTGPAARATASGRAGPNRTFRKVVGDQTGDYEYQVAGDFNGDRTSRHPLVQPRRRARTVSGGAAPSASSPATPVHGRRLRARSRRLRRRRPRRRLLVRARRGPRSPLVREPQRLHDQERGLPARGRPDLGRLNGDDRTDILWLRLGPGEPPRCGQAGRPGTSAATRWPWTGPTPCRSPATSTATSRTTSSGTRPRPRQPVLELLSRSAAPAGHGVGDARITRV